ncbi:hypothetical protein LDG_5936 [Legionella drancourtii LLAP12]|uniref:Uncharacterized protein n=1 Tax=Legionella drancourtii LLAP12 TaxID=658187 RepID=G9ELD8_9GAMM|nr:hypothetical protein LDG_5936 [Legionella drancourtii LLAP12]
MPIFFLIQLILQKIYIVRLSSGLINSHYVSLNFHLWVII